MVHSLSHVITTLLDISQPYTALIKSFIHHGGTPVLVGGCVRDALLGIQSHDLDMEIFGLDIDTVQRCMTPFGNSDLKGKHFGVLRLKNLDISLPRHDLKVGEGHKGFTTCIAPHISFKDAAYRRDFTINAMGFDLASNIFLDPYNGHKDLRNKKLRIVSPLHFGEDPLRGLRALQLIARFDLTPDHLLIQKVQTLPLHELPKERITREIRLWLNKGHFHKKAMKFMLQAQLIPYIFPKKEKQESYSKAASTLDYYNLQNPLIAALIFYKHGCINTAPFWLTSRESHLFSIARNLLSPEPTTVYSSTYTLLKTGITLSQLHTLFTALSLTLLPPSHPPIITGKDLIHKGLTPSSSFASILLRCFYLQCTQKLNNKDSILSHALKESFLPDTKHV